MTASLVVFGVVFALLWVLDQRYHLVRSFLGPWRHFTIFHVALLCSAAVTMDRVLVQIGPRVVYGIYLIAGVAGVFWAGLLARQENQERG